MAKTLLEGGANTDVKLGSSQDIQNQAPSIQPTQVRAKGDTLAKDLLAIMGKGADIIKERNTLSVKAAERVASDSLTQMAIEFEDIKATTKPDADIEETKALYETVYQKYGRKKFDNADAQRAFDKAYHNTAALATSKQLSILTAYGMKRDHEALVEKVKQDMTKQLDGGVIQTIDAVTQNREQITAGGYKTAEQADDIIASQLIGGMNRDYQINKNLSIYTNGKVDNNLQAKEFNRMFGGMATMSKDGSVVAVGKTTAKAVQTIQNAWNTLKLKDKNGKGDGLGNFNFRWSETKSMQGDVKANANSNFLTSVEIEKNINALKKASMEAEEAYRNGLTGGVTPASIAEFQNGINDLKNLQLESDLVIQDIMNSKLDPKDIAGYIQKGKKIEGFVTATGDTVTRVITPSKYQTAINRFQEEASTALTAIDPKDTKAFNSKLFELKRYERLSGDKSSFTQKFAGMLDPKYSTETISVDDAYRLNAYVTFMANTGNDAYKNKMPIVKRISEALGRHDEKDPLKTQTLIYNVMNTAKNRNVVDRNSKAVKEGTASAINDISSGSILKHGTFLSEDMAGGTEATIEAWVTDTTTIKENMSSDLIRDKINSNFDTYDYGSNIPTAKEWRVLKPKRLTDSEVKNHLNTLFTEYGKKYSVKLSEADTYPVSDYNSDTHEVFIKIFTRDTDSLVGTVTTTGAKISKTRK